MINQFVYNGKRSFDDMDLIITETPNIESPERDFEFTSIDGKNGDVITDNNKFKNFAVEYKVTALAEKFEIEVIAKKLKRWLQGNAGYHILSDTYDPNYFRYATYIGALSIADKMRLLGSATLKFNCKPFKYSFDGQRPIKISAPTTIYNPEEWESAPYMKIVANGDITIFINNTAFSFTSVDGYIEIDSEIMLAYKGTELRNNKIKFNKFPCLFENKNDISFIGDISEIIIIPRWCTL